MNKDRNMESISQNDLSDPVVFDLNESVHSQQELTTHKDSEQKFTIGNSFTSCEYDDIGEFFFESDHVALKGNKDYKNLLEAITILEAQRIRAVQDLDQLVEAQNKALSDPINFVEQLQKKQDLNLPKLQRIASLPNIDWSQYVLGGDDVAFGRRQLTRLSTRTAAEYTKLKLLEGSAKEKKFYSEQKPPLYNQPWTAEEQKRLEDLLIQYPPEEVESRRWKKIAKALGNRTYIQVASRVQKYFIKLAKAGLPVPGRAPNKIHIRKNQRQVLRTNPSTFLTSHLPPVYMTDGDEERSASNACSLTSSLDEDCSSDAKFDFSDEEMSTELIDTPEYKELQILKKVYQEKLSCSGLLHHVGYKCNRCESNPIIGTRWHCTDCPPPESVDFCNDCVGCTYEEGSHKVDHNLEKIQEATFTDFDGDYTRHLGGDYNYLDPNYMPAI